MRLLPFAVAAIAAFLPAQIASTPVVDHAVNVDSGYLANGSANEVVVFRQDITAGNGDWLQLHFRDTNLPPASRLRIAATSDLAAAQWFDAHSLRDYRFWSCQFNGPTLRVELHAAPGSTGNRVLVDVVRELQVSMVVSPDTICGPTDDRVLSSDPRACRINSSCTGWLFGPYAVGTAGHCMSTTSGQMLHFNVPLSTATGATQPAHPNDQYAQEAFHPFLNNGIGNDWSVSAAVRNSNTGLFPGHAQGSWYNVTPAPTTISGTIRVTGYGTGNGTSGSPTWNQVQKTHTGARTSTTNATAVTYQTDTTGGNSGSPVIHEQTGDVIGVHTHGGCTASGTGSNSGTNAVRPDWTAARAQVFTLHTAGEYTTFGTGCGGAAGVPAMGFSGIPEINGTVTVRTNGLHAAAGFGAFLIGFDNTTWGSNALPMPLDPMGLQGCQMLVDPEITRAVAPAAGQATMPVVVPASVVWVGTTVFFQYVCLDATAPNSAGAVMSNGGRVFVGN